jgi:hypothetical protein
MTYKEKTLEEYKEFYRNSDIQDIKTWGRAAFGQRSETSLNAFMWWGHQLHLRDLALDKSSAEQSAEVIRTVNKEDNG